MELAKQILEMNKRLVIGLVALAVAFALSLGAHGASANPPTTPPANQPYVVTGEQVTVAGIRHKGTILEDVKMNQGTKERQCRWVSGGYNSGRSVNGELQWFHDPVRAKICRNPNSPTGWVKVDGGQSGRNCGNPYKPEGPAPGPVVNGPVVMVRNFNNVNMNATAKASVNLSAEVTCPDGAVLKGQSSGEATSSIRINSQTLLAAQGNTDNIEMRLREDVRAQALAKAQGNVNITCGTSVVPAVKIEEPKPEPPKPEKEVVIIHKEIESEKVEVPVEQPKPVAPQPQPKELPNTGPGAVVAAFIGVSSLASFAYTTITRRFGL